jgi:hypothetical protein
VVDDNEIATEARIDPKLFREVLRERSSQVSSVLIKAHPDP